MDLKRSFLLFWPAEKSPATLNSLNSQSLKKTSSNRVLLNVLIRPLQYYVVLLQGFNVTVIANHSLFKEQISGKWKDSDNIVLKLVVTHLRSHPPISKYCFFLKGEIVRRLCTQILTSFCHRWRGFIWMFTPQDLSTDSKVRITF